MNEQTGYLIAILSQLQKMGGLGAVISGNSNTTLTPATFGGNPVTGTTYTGAASINTSNAVMVLLDNTGNAAASYTYAGITSSLPAGQQTSFTAILDPTSNKLVPFAALSVNGTGTTLNVYLFPRQ